jgi:carboxyl-terminal processing protease
MTTKRLIFLFTSSVLMLLLLGVAVFGQVAPKGDLYRYLSIFSEVFSLVRSSYVEDVPADQLVDGAFSGATEAIDEYSYYVPPTLMPKYRGFTPDDVNAVGLTVSKRFGYGYVIAPVAGSTAALAGIEAGDFVEKIDGAPTQKMAIWQIQAALQGDHSKPAEIVIVRGGLTKREKFTLVRGSQPSAPPETMMYGDVAYVKLPQFGPGSAAQFATLIDQVQKGGQKKLIVDLRGNAAGSTDEAIAAVDALLSRGAITSLAGRRVDPKSWNADATTAYDGDVEVLVDHSSAGGAEVFAAAIRGNSRGKLVGITSYGKALVQRLIPLSSGGALYMTIAHYTLPDGKPITDQGIKPDVVVDLSSNAIDEDEHRPKNDLILQKALELYGQHVQIKVAA